MNVLTVLGQAVGLIAAGIMIVSFQFKENKKLFLAQVISSTLFSVHYLLLGLGGDNNAFAGMAQNIGVLIFKAVILLSEKFKKLSSTLILGVLCAYSAVFAVLTYSGGIINLAPMVACIVSYGAFWTKKPNVIRIEQFAVTSPLWLIYNISTFSISGIITEIFNMVSIIVYYIRIKAIKKSPPKDGDKGDNQ